MFHNGTTESSRHLNGPNVGKTNRYLGVLGAQGTEVDLQGRRIGIHTGGSPDHLLIIGGGDSNQLIVPAGLVEQFHDGLVLHGSLGAEPEENVSYGFPFSTRPRNLPV